MNIDHPYYPRNLKLLKFQPPIHSMTDILIPFFCAIGLILFLGAKFISNKTHSLTTNQTGTKAVFLWFLTCGFIHTVTEGYFAFNHSDIETKTTFLADLWKEYAKSDSRYLSGDSFVFVMEAFTSVVWGSLSFLCCYMIYNDYPGRHLLQVIVSVGQAYGDILYYATTLIEDSPHCNPHFFYFYFYFGSCS